MNKRRKVDVENRVFNKEWKTKYFFTNVNNKAICLICHDSVAVLKEYNIKRHFNSKHKGYNSELNSEARSKAADKLAQNLSLQQNTFTRMTKEEEDATKASYVIAHIIAKKNKPFSDGEYIKECMIAAADIVSPSIKNKLQNVSLSRRTITRRIECIGDDLNMQLLAKLQSITWYSIALDESTDLKDTAQLLIFIRACTPDFDIIEELLSMESMKDQTTGNDIFEQVENCLIKYELPWNKLVSVTTDGAPSLTGKHSGVLKKMKDKISEESDKELITIHCILHQQALCKNVLQVEHVTSRIVKLVNFIRSRGLNHRQFTSFLQDLDSEYTDVLYHSHIRWLSLGKVLRRIWELKNEINLFLEMKNISDFPELKDHNWLCDFAFALDIITHLNVLNEALQGNNKYAYNLFTNVKAFQLKLNLFKKQLSQERLDHFPTVKTLNISTNKLTKYLDIITKLSEEYSRRFADFGKIENLLSIVHEPFSVDIEKIPSEFQLEIIDLQCNNNLKDLYRSEEICSFYKSLDSDKFSNLKTLAKKMFVIFGSTYICEQTFSLMNFNKNPFRSCISDEHLKAVLRISTTKFSPDFQKIIGDAKKFHFSH